MKPFRKAPNAALSGAFYFYFYFIFCSGLRRLWGSDKLAEIAHPFPGDSLSRLASRAFLKLPSRCQTQRDKRRCQDRTGQGTGEGKGDWESSLSFPLFLLVTCLRAPLGAAPSSAGASLLSASSQPPESELGSSALRLPKESPAK